MLTAPLGVQESRNSISLPLLPLFLRKTRPGRVRGDEVSGGCLHSPSPPSLTECYADLTLGAMAEDTDNRVCKNR